MKNLREARNEAGLTQKKISEIVGISQQSYSDYENGRTFPDEVTLINLANVLNVPIDYLLGRIDDFGVPVSLRQDFTDEEQSFLDLFRRLSRGERVQLLAFAAGLVGKGRPETETGG